MHGNWKMSGMADRDQAFDQNLTVVYSQWVTEKEKGGFQNGEPKEVIVHDELLLKNRKHFFNIRNQNNQRNTEIQNVSYTLIL